MASKLYKLDLLVIRIDGRHIDNDLVLVAALGIDGGRHEHPPGLVEGATENATVVQALINNLIERGLNPNFCRLFIIHGVRAPSKVIRPGVASGLLEGLDEIRTINRLGLEAKLRLPQWRCTGRP